jgi:2-polyprenyl-6-methoxyphenol hydroxylase-like FAD-dependent oxidoreductase
LKAPQSSQDGDDLIYQVCISGSTEKEPFCNEAFENNELTNEERVAIIRTIAEGFAEPFRSFLSLISDNTVIKQLALDDFAPQQERFTMNRCTLVGDASHAMAMCKSQHANSHLANKSNPVLDRGEGANHAIVDVLELKEIVLPRLNLTAPSLQLAIQEYEQSVAKRTLPAVLASRQACLDAHDWANLTPKSPLLTRRQMILDHSG